MHKTINSLQHLERVADGQITAQKLINRRLNINGKGWCDITYKDNLYFEICQKIADVLGGRGDSHKNILNTMLFSRPQMWGLDRIILNKGKFSYCAGQDYPSELRSIRKFLNR